MKNTIVVLLEYVLYVMMGVACIIGWTSQGVLGFLVALVFSVLVLGVVFVLLSINSHLEQIKNHLTSSGGAHRSGIPRSE